MAYGKHTWKEQIGTFLNRFTKSNETATTVDLTQAGTPFSTQWMNEMEQGIADAHSIADANFGVLNAHADSVDGRGRNLLTVLGVSTIAQAMAALRTLCNGTGTPDFSKLRIGDYLDGINLSAIPAENGGTAGQAFNGSYLNNRIVISGFNTYKGGGDTENTKNHILFTFRNIPLQKRMNPTNVTVGGYHATELRAFMDGTNGDGTGAYAGSTTVTTGAFLVALKGQLGDYILKIRRLLDESNYGVQHTWAWRSYSVFIPTENEMLGDSAWGRADYGDGYKVHIPLYANALTYRVKRYNGSRMWHWLATPSASSAAYFSNINNNGNANNNNASGIGGCAPDSVRCCMVGR